MAVCNAGSKEVDPRDIRFSQSSVNGAAELTHSMKTKGWAGEPVDVVRMSDGKLTTIDNTRILAASRAKIKVQARIHEGNSPLPEEFIERLRRRREYLQYSSVSESRPLGTDMVIQMAQWL